MTKRAILLGTVLAVFASLAVAAPRPRKSANSSPPRKTYVGVVSDEHCGVKHARASADAAACVAKCAQGGSKYVLVSRGKVFQLEPQDKFAEFAGKRVRVEGTRNGQTITATNVATVTPRRRAKKAKAAATTGK